jgi:hypothetical protein
MHRTLDVDGRTAGHRRGIARVVVDAGPLSAKTTARVHGWTVTTWVATPPPPSRKVSVTVAGVVALGLNTGKQVSNNEFEAPSANRQVVAWTDAAVEALPQRKPGAAVLRLLDHVADQVGAADGSSFTSATEKNPTLTILALSWRAIDYLADQMKQGVL